MDSGLPVLLKPLEEMLINKTIPRLSLQVILSQLFSSRGLELPADPNIKTITEPLKEGSMIDGLDRYAREF